MMLIRLTVPEVELDLGSLSRRVERLEAALAAGAAGSHGRAGTPDQREPSARPAPVPAALPAARPSPSAPAPAHLPVEPPIAATSAVRSGAPAAPERGDLGWGATARQGSSARPVPARQVSSSAPARAVSEGRSVSAPQGEVAAPMSASASQDAAAKAAGPPPGDAREAWQRMLTILKERDRRLQAVLVDARVQSLEAEELAIAFPSNYSWHFGRFQESRTVVEEVAREVLGRAVRVTGTLGGEIGAAPPPRDEHRSFVTRAESLFNGRVVGEPPV